MKKQKPYFEVRISLHVFNTLVIWLSTVLMEALRISAISEFFNPSNRLNTKAIRSFSGRAFMVISRSIIMSVMLSEATSV